MMMSLDQKWQSCVLRDTSGGDKSFPGVGQLGLCTSGRTIVIRLAMVIIKCAADVGLFGIYSNAPATDFVELLLATFYKHRSRGL